MTRSEGWVEWAFVVEMESLEVPHPARALDLDVEPEIDEAPRDKVVLARNNFDQYVLRGSKGPRVRTRLDNQLKTKVEEAARTHGLSKNQVEKLRLAGRGDIKRLFDQIEVKRIEFEHLRMDVNQGRQFLSDQTILRAAYQDGPFDAHSLFAKTLKNVVESR